MFLILNSRNSRVLLDACIIMTDSTILNSLPTDYDSEQLPSSTAADNWTYAHALPYTPSAECLAEVVKGMIRSLPTSRRWGLFHH